MAFDEAITKAKGSPQTAGQGGGDSKAPQEGVPPAPGDAQAGGAGGPMGGGQQIGGLPPTWATSSTPHRQAWEQLTKWLSCSRAAALSSLDIQTRVCPRPAGHLTMPHTGCSWLLGCFTH